MKPLNSFLIIACFALQTFCFGISPAMAKINLSLLGSGQIPSEEPDKKEAYYFARRMGQMDCDNNSHHNNDCGHRGMGHRRGRGHGMRHGMGRGPGIAGEAQCPQPRSTAKAPEDFFNITNPLEGTTENIEKGRLLFQLDAQPTCTVCHGSGDGLGMMSGGLTPPPRNFMCKDTMEKISDGQLFWIIKNGSPGTGMPSFSDLSDEQVWQLIHFIRQLSQ